MKYNCCRNGFFLLLLDHSYQPGLSHGLEPAHNQYKLRITSSQSKGREVFGRFLLSSKYIYTNFIHLNNLLRSHIQNRRRKLWKVLQQNYGGFNQLYKKIFIQETFLNIEDQKMPWIIRKLLNSVKNNFVNCHVKINK